MKCTFLLCHQANAKKRYYAHKRLCKAICGHKSCENQDCSSVDIFDTKSDHFLKIARKEFHLEKMKKRLANEYRCYQDKGNSSVKHGKMQNVMTIGLEQLRKSSQTAAELKITAKKLYNIADCAFRLAVEETLSQRAEQKETSEETLSDEPFQMSMSV